jgi:hypothetical protein
MVNVLLIVVYGLGFEPFTTALAYLVPRKFSLFTHPPHPSNVLHWFWFYSKLTSLQLPLKVNQLRTECISRA